MFALLLVGMLAWLETAMPAGAGYLRNWQWENPLPQGNKLHSVAYGNGLFVAVGDWGSIVTSADGINWKVQGSGTTSYLTSVAYAKGVFVAVGSGIFTSADGVRWTSQAAGDGNDLYGVTYANDRFLAVGMGSAILESADGVHWSRSALGDWWYYSVGWANGLYVVTRQYGRIITSPDGVNWTVRDWGMQGRSGLALVYGAGTWVAVGTVGLVATSTNGLDWTDRTDKTTQQRDLRAVCRGDGLFVAVGSSGIILTSPNGARWTSHDWGATYNLNSVAYGQGTYVAVGEHGKILSSTDGVNWTVRSAGVRNGMGRPCYGNSTVVAVTGGNEILVSHDHEPWSTVVIPRADFGISACAYGQGRFVAVGRHGEIFTSTDTQSWIQRDSPAFRLDDIVYGGGRFVAVGYGGRIVTSSDGIAWSGSGSGEELHGITHGRGLYVAVGDKGTILTSADGINWVSREASTTKPLTSVTYGDGLFVAVGNSSPFGYSSEILTSSDGVNWTARQPVSTTGLWDVAYGNGLFVAVGGYVSNWGGGTVSFSEDGQTWIAASPRTENMLTGVAYLDGRFLIAGENGSLLTVDAVEGPSDLDFDASSTIITNPWLGLTEVGDGYILAGTADFSGAARSYRLTGRERVLGVDCLVLRIAGRGNDPESDYYDARIAQDVNGDLYVLKVTGEKDGAPFVWTVAAVEKARLFMPAVPEVAQTLNWPWGRHMKIVDTDYGFSGDKLSTGMGPYDWCVYGEWDDDESDSGQFWWSRNVGVVREAWSAHGQTGGWERAGTMPHGWVIYDDFDGADINTLKWRAAEKGHGILPRIATGKAHLAGDDADAVWSASSLAPPDAGIYGIRADLSLQMFTPRGPEASRKGQLAIRIEFPGGQAAAIELHADGAGLRGRACVEETARNQAVEQRQFPIQIGGTYNLGIVVSPDRVEFMKDGVVFWAYSAGPASQLLADAASIEAAGVLGAFEGTVDNVSVLRTPAPADEDGDGLPDDWEQQIVDADTSDDILTEKDVSPADDFDGDGLSNGWEYEEHTNPTDSPIIYVAQGTRGPEDGHSWKTAYSTLQDALESARAGDQIWVAAGTYHPTEKGDRGASFNMVPGTAMYGSFTGTETSLAQRRLVSGKTVLSGEIGVPKDRTDNSLHVIVGADHSVLDGFSIIGGCADGEGPDRFGAGLHNCGITMRITNCRFAYNRAASAGGATDNTVADNGRACSVSYINCLFEGNCAPQGGAVRNDKAALTITNCTLTGNLAEIAGGAILNDEALLRITNCILWNNQATTDQQIAVKNSPTSIRFSDVDQSGYAGSAGDLREEPMFARPGYFEDNGTEEDVTDDKWISGDYVLLPASPCIDAGDGTAAPDNDAGGQARLDDLDVTPDTGTGTPTWTDIGAYEYRGSTSFALTLQPGWNLLSLPCEVAERTSPEQLLFSADGKPLYCSATWRWRPRTGCYTETSGQLPAMKGFWVFSSHDQSMTTRSISGVVPPDSLNNLYEGWNLVGPVAPCKVAEMTGVANVLLPVWSWDSSSGGYRPLGNLDTLEPGRGYWMYVSRNCQIELPVTAP